MKKIPTIFVRDFTKRPHLVTPEVTPGCEWVFSMEGIATRKWDGTCVLFRDGKMYARYDCKKGRTPPESFEPCEPEPDLETGHWPGWVLVEEQPQYKWHRKAFDSQADGTYELVGPKVNGNPEGLAELLLVQHGFRGDLGIDDRSFDGLKVFLTENLLEGVVFHHDDGKMAKIKRKDYGLPWPVKAS